MDTCIRLETLTNLVHHLRQGAVPSEPLSVVVLARSRPTRGRQGRKGGQLSIAAFCASGGVPGTPDGSGGLSCGSRQPAAGIDVDDIPEGDGGLPANLSSVDNPAFNLSPLTSGGRQAEACLVDAA